MNEHEVVTRLQAGDIDALQGLVAAHHVRAVRAAYLVTRDLGIAEEVVQAAWIRAYERIGQFDAARPFAPWFLRLVMNHARNTVERRDREVALAEPFAAAAPGAEAAAETPEATLEQAETAAEVWAALGTLPVAQRVAVVQRYYLGLSEAEMATAQACPPNTVKWRLHAARLRLRGLLRPLVVHEVERSS